MYRLTHTYSPSILPSTHLHTPEPSGLETIRSRDGSTSAWAVDPHTTRFQTNSEAQAERLRKVEGSRQVGRSPRPGDWMFHYEGVPFVRIFEIPQGLDWARSYLTKQERNVRLVVQPQPEQALAA